MLDYININEFKSALSEATLKDYYDYWGSDDELYRFLKDSYVNKSLSDYLVSRKIDVKGKSILEFGCRDGSSFISFLASGAGKIIGIDIDEKVINLSRKIYSDLGISNIEYRRNFLNKSLPAYDEEFDIVSCNAILEHIHPDLRLKYIAELQKKVKKGGYIIISDTPNKLWLIEGHTTALWFLNYLPFKKKCWVGSKTKRFKDIKQDDYNFWIEQGIEGVSYKEVLESFDMREWENETDIKFKNEYKDQIFNFQKRNLLKKLKRYLLFIFAYSVDVLYLRPNKFPSLAISPVLVFSFRKKIDSSNN
jgi:2-polyprenyl-3-methyl-5-hydroxy-6-metoxy-1,4-benzoquinol methylase